tara:strand:+ start:2439 stop:3617 length:1179 start_codon:yes stop_codon:yes gene_type:complete
MFFKTKRNRRKTTRQTLSTEQLEPKAMFSVSPVEPVVALDVGPVNQAGYDCTNAGTCSGIWTNGGASTLRIGGNSGPGGTSFMTGEDGYTHCMHELHFQGFTTGAGGDSIVHPQFSGAVNSLAVANHSPSLIGDSDRPGDVGTSFEGRTTSDHDLNDITLHASANPHAGPEGFMKLGDIKGEFKLTQRIGGSASPGGDDIFMPKPNRGVSLHDSVHCLVGGVGKGTFTPVANANGTATLSIQIEDGRMIVHPQFNVGNDGRMIIHPQFNVGDDGRMIIHPQFSVGKATFTTGTGGDSIVHPQFNGGEDGRSIVHPQFNVGEETLPTGTIISHEDSHLSAKDLIGNPPEPKIAPPAPHVSDRVAVIDGGSDRFQEVVRTSSVPRLEVFARMGR